MAAIRVGRCGERGIEWLDERGGDTAQAGGETERGKEKSVRWKITVRFISDLSLIVI